MAFKADVRASAAGAMVKGGKPKEATDLASVLAREISYEMEDPTSEAKARRGVFRQNSSFDM